MAQDAVTGPKDQPRFSETGAPEIGTDNTIVADYAALVGNRKVGTLAEMNALTGKKRWPGLAFQTTDGTKGEYVDQGTSWKAVIEDTGWIAFGTTVGAAQGTAGNLGGSWRPIGSPWEPVAYRRQNGIGFVKGFLDQGNNLTIFTLPPGFRPAGLSLHNFIGTAGGQSGALVYLQADGRCVIQGFFGGATSTAGLYLDLFFAVAS
jgi:hypothetical protein